MNGSLYQGEFLLLHARVAELKRLRRRERLGLVALPHDRGGPDLRGDEVEAGEFFAVMLGTVARGIRRLRGGRVGIDLGGDPLALSFSGQIVGAAGESTQIFLRIQPQGRRRSHA